MNIVKRWTPDAYSHAFRHASVDVSDSAYKHLEKLTRRRISSLLCQLIERGVETLQIFFQLSPCLRRSLFINKRKLRSFQ